MWILVFFVEDFVIYNVFVKFVTNSSAERDGNNVLI